jgi:glutamine amidotransferase
LIAILDYGSGNLHSAQRAFAETGHDVILTSDPAICASADGLVLPGVGAYGSCMTQLRAAQGDEIVRTALKNKQPVFGICVGEQILFSQGSEKGITEGIGFFEGSVDSLRAPILPHMGWNVVKPGKGSRLFAGMGSERFYFVHSYAAKKTTSEAVVSTSVHGEEFIAAIEMEMVVATQFHPEKSGAAGLKLIRNWADSL